MTTPPAAEADVTYSLSSFPPLLGGATLLVGVEEDPSGSLRAYLGARYKGVYLLVDDDSDKDAVRRAWNSGGHVWLSPVPPREMLLLAEKPDPDSRRDPS